MKHKLIINIIYVFLILGTCIQLYPSDRCHFDENINCNTKRFVISNGPCRPDIDFPYKIYEDGKSFRFSTFFYTMKLKSGINVPRFWLCYSVGWNVAYCETCWLFANRQYAYYQDSWVNGINDWRHISSKIDKHESSVQHIDARKNRSNWEKNLTIDKNVEHQYTIEINYWRNVLKKIIKIILSLTAGNTALRGHEHKDNQGKLSSPNLT